MEFIVSKWAAARYHCEDVTVILVLVIKFTILHKNPSKDKRLDCNSVEEFLNRAIPTTTVDSS